MNLNAISKTSLNGALAFVIAACTFIATQPGLGISPKVAGWISVVAGLARLAVGILQTDSDAILATLPGSSTPQVVAAHPTPDDPSATPILPAKK